MKRILLLVCALLLTGAVTAGEDQSKSAEAVQNTYEVKLVDGTILIVKSHRFGSKFVIFSLGDGSTLAYRREDIQIQTLPAATGQGREPDSPAEHSKPTDGAVKPESLGDRRLQDVAKETHLSDDEIFIVGDGTVSPAAPSNFDELRAKALAEIEIIAERYSEPATKLTKDILEYQNSCSGYTVTHHKGETSGIGIVSGAGEAYHDGAWLGGTSGGEVAWGVYSGETTFTFDGLATWHEEQTWTSTTANWETPYCRGLWSETLILRDIVEPALHNAVQNARLNFVFDSEINTVFLSYGIGPVGFWVPDLR